MCVNDEPSHQVSNEHMDENSDSDLYDHKVMTSDIPDKSDNQQINEHIDISTPSLQINPDVCHHDSFASSVIGSLTSDDTNDDNITNSIKSVCPDLSTKNSVRLSDIICDAHDTNDTNIGSVTPDVIAIKTVGDTLHDDDTDMNSVPLGVNEMLSEAYHVGSYIREWFEDMVDFIVDHHVQESLVKCHGEDLAVDHNADSVVNLDNDESIVHHSDDESNDSDQHYEYPDGYQTKGVMVTYWIAIIMSCSVMAPTVLVICVIIKWMLTSWPWWNYLAAHFYNACRLLMMVSMVLV